MVFLSHPDACGCRNSRYHCFDRRPELGRFPAPALERKGFSIFIAFTNTYQEGEGGIADAPRLAEPFVEGEQICVVLGDNLIENNIHRGEAGLKKQAKGAHILLKEVPDPERLAAGDFKRPHPFD